MRYAIGLDIGGTKIEGALVDEKAHVLVRYRIRTEAHGPKQRLIQNINTLIKQLKTQTITGIGLGIPGIARNGRILFTPNIPTLKNINIVHLIQTKFHIPTMVANDANCFALAEHRWGAGKNTKNMLGVIIGTGVGSGIIINDNPYTGSGFAGEIGHTVINPAGIRCACGTIGDLESWCSGPNIVRHYKRAGGKMKNPNPARIFSSREQAAIKTKRQAIQKLAMGLANAANTLDPELIILGGGLSNLPLYAQLNNEFKKYVKNKSIKIVKNGLGDSAGVLGAAALVFHNNL